MKKAISILLSIIILLNLSGCTTKKYNVGTTQEIDGVEITVYKVYEVEYVFYASNKYYSKNGSLIKVFFTVINTSDEKKEIRRSDFIIKDGIINRKMYTEFSNMPSEIVNLPKNEMFEFYAVFDCKRSFIGNDLQFIWKETPSCAKQKRIWVL